MATRKEVLALHRYYYWAGSMRFRFGEELAKATSEDEVKNAHFLAPYLPYYLAGMYSVAAGWKRLRIRDTEVDTLLKDAGHLKLLESFRHGVYHFHPEYYDTKFRGFWARGRDALDWTEKLFAAFDKFFRRWLSETKLEVEEAMGPGTKPLPHGRAEGAGPAPGGRGTRASP